MGSNTTKHYDIYWGIYSKFKFERIDSEGAKCERCGRKHNLTLEHIIPLSILRDMGIDEKELQHPEDNWMVLCRICNSLKSNHLDFTLVKTQPLLLKFLNMIEPNNKII